MPLRKFAAAALLALVPMIGQAFTPESGWYIPVTSDNTSAKGGTGIGIEIQNEFLFAAGFIYGQNGLPIWVAMQGQLKKQADGSWALEDDHGLYSAQNGQCLGSAAQCPYKSPTKVDIGGFKISFPADNIGQITWGITGNQASATLLRFTYNLGNAPQSLTGRWDVLIEHQASSNADSVQYDGDRIRITSVTKNSDGSYAIGGCVENFLEPSTQECDASPNVFAIKGTATKASLFGSHYTLDAYTFSFNGSTPKIMRVYQFDENGLGGPFSGTIKGTVNLCGASGAATESACTFAKNVPFTAYRSASAQYSQTGNGMDQKLPN